MNTINFAKYNSLENQTYYKKMGKVVNIVGLTIESAGPDAKLGDLCCIYPGRQQADPRRSCRL